MGVRTADRGRLRVEERLCRGRGFWSSGRGRSRGYNKQTESGWEPQGAGKPQHPQPTN